jgi:glutathione S-transferase
MEENMDYTLYGSLTSPFVRRLRILLDETPYEFQELSIFETEDAIKLNKINPLNQVPVFKDGNNVIWDSRQIFNYLNSLHRFQNMDWNDENQLTAIDGAITSGVSLLLMKRSSINIDEQYMYVVRLKDKMQSVLDYLKPYIEGEALTNWNFHTISLYCFLDWATFRGILKLDNRPECQALLDKYKNLPIVVKTQIPKV